MPAQRGPRGGGATDRDDLRLWQDGFHVNLQCAFALARDRNGDDAVARAPFELLRGAQEQQPRRPLLERLQRLSDDRRLGARPAEPAAHLAIRHDERGRALLAGRRRAPPYDGRQHERLSPPGELRRELEDVRLQAEMPAFAFSNASHTFADVTGMSMFLTPDGHNASITALTYAAGEPTVADSPTPLAPIG